MTNAKHTTAGRDSRDLMAVEEKVTGPCAQLSSWATHRHAIKSEGRQYELRTPFQHDRDRIIHSRSFRRLKHKTQVFIPYDNDHHRTRLTHTIEVMQISRTITRCLSLNEDLTEAIAFGHDLGHTPFGHVGEKTLKLIMNGRRKLENVPAELVKNGVGFKHNLQSIRVVDLLEERYQHPGLNLSDHTREGILKHTSWEKWTDYPGLDGDGLNLDRKQPHFEGQVVRVADEIAQQTHDLEDGLRAGIVDLRSLERLKLVQNLKQRITTLKSKNVDRFTRQNTLIRSLIHVLVVDVINQSATNLQAWRRKNQVKNHEDFYEKQVQIDKRVNFSKGMLPYFKELQKFVHENVIRSTRVQLNDESGIYFITELFRIFYDEPRYLPPYMLNRYSAMKKIKHLHYFANVSTADEIAREIRKNYQGDPDFLRLICDYIAGMSNTYALREYEKWIMPFPG